MNVLPFEIKNKRIERIQKIILSVVSAVLGCVFIYLLTGFSVQIHMNKSRLEQEEAYLAYIKQIILLKERIADRQKILEHIHDEEIPFDGVLKIVSQLTPDEVILKRLVFDSYGGQLTLSGIFKEPLVNEETILSKWVRDLQNSAFFDDARLTLNKKAENVREFQISAEFIDPEN